MKGKTIILSITPQPALAFNQKSKVVFYIPEDCRSRQRVTGLKEDKNLPCDHYSEENPYCYHLDENGEQVFHTLSKKGRAKKKRIKRYLDYKDALRELAIDKGFEYPTAGLSITFYLPVAKRWSKSEKRHRHLTWHQNRPDLKNLLSAFEDAILLEDKCVANYSSLSKKWVNFEQGWIEVILPSEKDLEQYNSHYLKVHEIIIP